MSEFSRRIVGVDTSRAPTVEPQTPKPQVFVKVGSGEGESDREQDDLEEQARMMDEINAASSTKFATGNPERDLFLYRKFKSIMSGLTELIE